jgi:multidrug resistance efflux pump
VEAVSRNVRVSPPFAALVLEVMVEVNDRVEAGQPLLRLDARELEADRAALRAALDVARAQVARLENEPRPEEVLVLEASDAATEAELEDARDAYDRIVNARDSGAASSSELDSATWKLRFAEALRRRAAYNLALTRAGAWSYDIEIARARVAEAEAALASLEDRIDRYTVRAPIAGTILKRSVEPGEFLAADGNSASLVLGDISRLRVRAQIDEADLPFFVAGAPATARPRGRGDLAIDLSFVRLEPYAIVKTDLTGLALERVDTRIIEALYDVVGTPAVPLVPGQLVDVYIDASSAAPSGE